MNAELPTCRFRTADAGGLRCACPRVRAAGRRVRAETCLRCPWREPHDGDADPGATPPRGLGDTIARWTSAVGLRPCRGCKQRQAWLNRLVSYAPPVLDFAAALARVQRADLRRTAVVIPVVGQHRLTHQVLRDIRREGVDVWIVDGGGDYRPLADEHVLRPGSNLGWVRGNNLGMARALATGRYDRCVLLNNDLRLSHDFFAGLLLAEQATGASIVAASYDGHWALQRPEHCPPAARYQPRAEHLPAGACDGTCVSVHRRVFESVGGLDEHHFGQFGWWAMTDWCIRAKQHGYTVAVTRAAYANHLGQRTGRAVHGDNYQQQAQHEAAAGRARKWGAAWRDLQAAWTLSPLVVYTAITGARDRLKDPRVAPAGVRWVCFTDDASHRAGCLAGARRWEVRPLHQALGRPRGAIPADPRRACKLAKCLPPAGLNCPQSIWLDASFQVRGDLRQLAWYLGPHDLALFDRGADRGVDCIYEEARRCLQAELDDPAVIAAQMARYRQAGHPPHWGLAWSGVLVRRHTPAIEAMGQQWLAEIDGGSKRDQLSHMVVLRRLGLAWSWIPGAVRRNPWLLQDQRRPQRPGLNDAAG